MPTPSAIDLLKKQLPHACDVADRYFNVTTGLHEHKEPNKKRSAERVLQEIHRRMDGAHSVLYALFHGSVRLNGIPLLAEIEPDRGVVQRTYAALEETFSDALKTKSDAEAIALRIAEDHGRFHAQMEAILAVVEKIEASTTKKPDDTPKIPKKPPVSPVAKPLNPALSETPTDPIEPPIVKEVETPIDPIDPPTVEGDEELDAVLESDGGDGREIDWEEVPSDGDG